MLQQGDLQQETAGSFFDRNPSHCESFEEGRLQKFSRISRNGVSRESSLQLNTRYTQIADVPCYPSLTTIPHPVPSPWAPFQARPFPKSSRIAKAAVCERFRSSRADLPVTLPLDLIQFEIRSGPYEDQSMKRSRFTEEQFIGILKEHESGVSVADLCRKHGVSDPASTNGKPSSVRWR